MKTFFSKIVHWLGRLISRSLVNKRLLKIYNSIYEHAPYPLIRIFVKCIELPDEDNEWVMVLRNKKKVKTTIHKNDLKTKQFALSYQWHSPALNFTEYLLNQFYDPDIPWIDVGANLGLRSLLALSEHRPVYFIEPNKELNKINIDRCLLNGFNHFTLYECGASDRSGEVNFYIDQTSYCSSIEYGMVSENFLDRIEKIKIETIDSLFKQHLDDFQTACVKIDVEGHELQVLEGARHFIAKLAPTIVIEINSKGLHFSKFLEKMREHDYEVYEIACFVSKKYFRKIERNLSSIDALIQSNDFLAVKDKSLQSFLSRHVF